MGLFGGRKRGDKKRKDKKRTDEQAPDVVEEAAPEKGPEKAPAPRRRKKSETMASVFQESVIESALADMAANDRFDVMREDGRYHVGWALDVNDIGGLSKRTNRDEAKGSIIQRVKNGSIKVLLNKALMDNDICVFITDEATCRSMNEFGLLRGASYMPIYVSDAMTPDGPRDMIIEDDGVTVSLADAISIHEGKTTINTLLADHGAEWTNPGVGTAPIDEPDMGDGDVPDETVVGDAGMGEFDDIDDFDEEGVGVLDSSDIDDALDESLFGGDVDEAPAFVNDIAASDHDIDQRDIMRQAQGSVMGPPPVEGKAAPAGAEPTEAVEEAPEEVESFITDSFFTNDLRLELSYEPFDAQFGDGCPMTYFEEERTDASEHIRSYLEHLSVEANLDMQHVHDANLYSLRTRFMRLVNSYASQVEADLDITDPNTEYGKAYQHLFRRYREMKDNIDRRAESSRSAIEREFESAAREEGERARIEAEQRYRQHHEREYKDRLADAERMVFKEIEIDFQTRIGELNDDRRNEARVQLDLGIAQILAELSRAYGPMCVAEQNLYVEHRNRIGRFMDTNRKNDLAYAEMQREAQRQIRQADLVRKDYEAQLAQQTRDFEQRSLAFEQELEAAKRSHEQWVADSEARHNQWVAETEARHKADLESAQVGHEADVQRLNAELEQARVEHEDLMDRFTNIDAVKEEEWRGRLAQAEEAIELEKKRYEELSKQNKGVTYTWIALFVAAVITAACVGVVFGMNASLSNMVGMATAGNTNDAMPAVLTELMFLM